MVYDASDTTCAARCCSLSTYIATMRTFQPIQTFWSALRSDSPVFIRISFHWTVSSNVVCSWDWDEPVKPVGHWYLHQIHMFLQILRI